MEVGDRDLFNPNVMRDNMHDWVVANENMAKVLAAKGYHYQFVFARNAGHTDRAVKQQTLPEALGISVAGLSDWQGEEVIRVLKSKTKIEEESNYGNQTCWLAAVCERAVRLVHREAFGSTRFFKHPIRRWFKARA